MGCRKAALKFYSVLPFYPFPRPAFPKTHKFDVHFFLALFLSVWA